MSRAVLELVAQGVLEEDLDGLDIALRDRDLAPEPVLLRQMRRGQVSLHGTGLVAGRLPFVQLAMQRLGIARPSPLDYVDAPEEILGRRVWPSTLGSVASHLDSRGEAVFVKPRGAAKQFTGRVVSDPTDLWAVSVTSPSTPVWCSDLIDIVSEWRVFIRQGEVVGVRHYDGDPSVMPPRAAILTILAHLADALPAGCAIDVAVTPEQDVVLVEANDGYSLGRYGLDGASYLEVLMQRWTQLLSTAT